MADPPRSSTVPAPDGAPDLTESVDAPLRAGQKVAAELEEALARHLYGGRLTADIAHAILAGFTVLMFWGVVPRATALAWLAMFLITVALRGINRHRALSRLSGPAALRALVRRDVWLAALLWGVLALLLIGATPKDLAFLLILFAGLVAAGTSTLVADGPAFFGFTALLIGPLAIAVAASGVTRDHLSLLVMIGLYTPFMVMVYRRAHEVLVEQIRSTARLRLSEEEAARRRDVLNSLVRSAPSPIVVLDDAGEIRGTNPAFDRMVPSPGPGETHRSILDVADGLEERKRLEEFLGWLRHGERRVREVSFQGRDDRSIWVRLSGTAARGMEPGTLILMGEDVTEQVEARHALEGARVQAEEAARAKSSFLASMSHEIRTPMNGILGMIEILLDTPLTSEQQRTAEVIRSSGHGLLKILNDILDVSKIEAGQLDLDEVDFDLHELVAEVGRIFTPIAVPKGDELLVDVGVGVPRGIRGDPHRLRQVLINLVGNAVKFTEGGDVVVEVRSEGPGDGGHRLRFSVRDTGVGIPLDKQEDIFEEFEQADRSTTRMYGGTGLGLTISKRLVELMGGRLRVDSEPGRGSDFYFTLILGDAVEPRVTDERRAPSSPTLRGGRFLVVDDNATARRIVRESLAQAGVAEVVEADSAEVGLAALKAVQGKTNAYAAIILDHMMPGRDGFDFVRAATAEMPGGVPPILMVTSAGIGGGETAARGVGIHGYLAKPVSRGDLIRALEVILGSEPPKGGERRLVTRETIGRRPQMRILLAEDNTVNQQVASTLLRKRGHEVVAVADGHGAVEAVEGRNFDLVLMDIQMPGMDGLEATRHIRKTRTAEDLPIIALTAHAFAEERERCRQAGMNDFLAKPFKPDDLYEMVERWTGGTSREEEVPQVESAGKRMDEGERTRPPVDIEAFRAMMRDAGVEEVVDVTLGIYVDDTPGLFSELAAAVDAGDGETVRAKAHSLKSASGNIRADAFARLLEHMEEAGARKSVDEMHAAFPELRAEYHAVMAYLREQSQG